MSKNPITEYGMKSDKVWYHHYDKPYNNHLQHLYENKGCILEIGFDEGNSIPLWKNTFPNAFLYGLDIGKSYEEDRCIVFKGDQSNIECLKELRNKLCDKDVFFINDDGSHIPEHQLLTFNTLFPILKQGGIYIIEDIETSYWSKSDCYGYPTNYGYKHPKSIIEIFKSNIDVMNKEFSNHNDTPVLHNNSIESITFSRNCIIIRKDEVIDYDRQYRMPQKL